MFFFFFGWLVKNACIFPIFVLKFSILQFLCDLCVFPIAKPKFSKREIAKMDVQLRRVRKKLQKEQKERKRGKEWMHQSFARIQGSSLNLFLVVFFLVNFLSFISSIFGFDLSNSLRWSCWTRWRVTRLSSHYSGGAPNNLSKM